MPYLFGYLRFSSISPMAQFSKFLFPSAMARNQNSFFRIVIFYMKKDITRCKQTSSHFISWSIERKKNRIISYHCHNINIWHKPYRLSSNQLTLFRFLTESQKSFAPIYRFSCTMQWGLFWPLLLCQSTDMLPTNFRWVREYTEW